MLNTIYEEFDFPSKIKDLKNKKIKIKRVIKGKEGEPDVHESIIIPKEKDPETKKILEEIARKKEKNTNPMFYSQNNPFPSIHHPKTNTYTIYLQNSKIKFIFRYHSFGRHTRFFNPKKFCYEKIIYLFYFRINNCVRRQHFICANNGFKTFSQNDLRFKNCEYPI